MQKKNRNVVHEVTSEKNVFKDNITDNISDDNYGVLIGLQASKIPSR